MDQRTLDLLIDRGVLDTDRVTATPTHRHCKDCRRVVLVALADDGPQVPGIRVTLDPRPLTTLGELHALLAGLATFAHHGGHITWRDRITISRRNADRMKTHHEHRCNPPPLEYRPAGNTTTTVRTYTDIPF